MGNYGRIELAHAPSFELGALVVHPETRELLHRDGRRETLEPRVMQVLLALARAEGGTVTRDELTRSCWEGRVVGEDAINRVLSRLRRVAEGMGAGSFRIETLTKVGYRLIAALDEPASTMPVSRPAKAPKTTPPRASRRGLLMAGGGIVGLAALGGLGFALLSRHRNDDPPTPEIATLIDQARDAYWQTTVDGATQAEGLLKQVVELAPNYADGWGLLALYQAESTHGPPSVAGRAMAYARDAIRRAYALDPDNSYAALAVAVLQHMPGWWGRDETALRRALAQHPRSSDMAYRLATVLENVGRMQDAAALLERYFAILNPEPGIAYVYGQILWASDRLDEADRWIEHIYAAYPHHYAVWFTRFYYFMYTDRCDQALAMARDVDSRPLGIPDEEFALISQVATAIKSRAPADVEAAMRAVIESAHAGAGLAENAIQFSCALGWLDDAFRIANAYYFGRGFQIGAVRFTRQQGGYSRLADRRTWFLFMPSTAKMRADPRFAKLTQEIGLDRYWREAGVTPDFRRH